MAENTFGLDQINNIIENKNEMDNENINTKIERKEFE